MCFFADSGAVTAFGRLRVANGFPQFSSKQIFDNQPLLWDDQEVSGSGTSSVYDANTAKSTLSVSATTAGKRVRQTYRSINYQPGQSQLIFMTFVLDPSGGGTGINRAVGQFDDNNGIFFEDDAGTYYMNIRSNETGTPADTRFAQSAWNIDKLDGTGPSGVTLDFQQNQILVIDYEWLGAGRVRVGFNVGGITYYCHKFEHANVKQDVYMSTPNLPLRFEIENTGSGVASALDAICVSVLTEGGIEPDGVERYASTAGTHVDATTENTLYAVIGIRLKSGYIGAEIDMLAADIALLTTTDEAEWVLLFNPTVAGTFTYSDESNSAVQIATGATANTISDVGIQMDGGYLFSGNNGGGLGGESAIIKNKLKLGAAIDGTVDEIVLAVRPINGSTAIDVEAGIKWREPS